jgi:hypothetical protein
LLHLDLVVVVLRLVRLNLLRTLPLGLVQANVEVLDLLGQLLLLQLPLGLVLLVANCQLWYLVLLDLHSSVLMLLLSGKVELLVLGVAILLLKLRILLFKHVKLVTFYNQLLLELADLVLK